MRVEQRMLHRQNTPQRTFTILPTEVANLPTETGSGGGSHPLTSPPLSARPERVYYSKPSNDFIYKRVSSFFQVHLTEYYIPIEMDTAVSLFHVTS